MLPWILLLLGLVQASIFGPKSGVKHLTARTFKDEVLYNGNVSAVVFYAPWCGYCQKLGPEWSKAAKRLSGLANVAAVNCDADVNKQLCAKYEVKGYPTIKVFQPAKLTDVDFKDAIEGKPLPKRRPKMFSYSGPRETKEIVNFVVSKLRNYAAALASDEALRWLAPNKVPRVIMLPGKNYKSVKVSPLFKVLSREYFGKMRFATFPRRIDGSWNLLGLQAVDDSQLIYLSEDKDAVIYKGVLKKRQIKQFLDEQYALEMNRRRHKGIPAKPQRSEAANGMEFIIEDPQNEKLEHVLELEQQSLARKQHAKSAREEAFARLGKEVPTDTPTGTENDEPTPSTTLHLVIMPDSTKAVTDEGEEVNFEDFDFADLPEASGEAETEAETETETSDDGEGDKTSADSGSDEASLESSVADIDIEFLVQEGPEAVSKFLSEYEAAGLPTQTTESVAPKATAAHNTDGIRDYDGYVKRCLRAGVHCGIVVAHNATFTDDLRTFITAFNKVPPKLKKSAVFDYMIPDDSPELEEFLAEIGFDRRPGLLWFDWGRQRLNFYEGHWNVKGLRDHIGVLFERKADLSRELPAKYLYWITKEEVEALEEAKRGKVDTTTEAAPEGTPKEAADDYIVKEEL